MGRIQERPDHLGSQRNLANKDYFLVTQIIKSYPSLRVTQGYQENIQSQSFNVVQSDDLLALLLQASNTWRR